jgi:hypothetical protein
MIDPGIAALVSAVFSGLALLVSAFGGAAVLYYNAQTKRQLETAFAQTTELGRAIDGRMTQLLERTATSSAAKGEKIGRADAHTEIEAVVAATIEKTKNGT